MRKKYEDLVLLPHIVASTVCGSEYKGQEWSDKMRSPAMVAKVEALRMEMTQEQVDEFCTLADERCRLAYDKRMPWFDKVVKAKGDRGRDLLYMWITHWMTSYLVNPAKMRRDGELRREACCK